MKVLSFIRQRSFARYVAIDLMSSAQHLGWSVHWMDIEGRLLVLGPTPEAERNLGLAAIADEASAADPHVVFSYGLEYLAPIFATVAPGDHRTLVGLLDKPAVYFLFDFGYPFDRPIDAATLPLIAALQSPDSLVLCWDREAVAVLRGFGILHATHFPMAVNHRIFTSDDAETSERDLPIVFAGGPSPSRTAALRAVADLGLQVYGYDRDGWADPALVAAHNPALMGRSEMAATYRRARLAINVTRPHGPSSLNMRVFEAMASGCLLLTDDRADVHALFTEGEHLRIYRSPSDLRVLAVRYLRDDSERRRLAAAGRERVVAEHTYDVRLGGVKTLIEQFVRQAMHFRKLRQYELSDASKALTFAAYLEAQTPAVLHPDSLLVVRARCQSRLGANIVARRSLEAAFSANPSSLAAWRAAHDLRHSDVIPEGLRSLRLT